MSADAPGPEFFARVNAIIDLANQQCQDAPPGQVSASLLYAVARFNAFVVASAAKDVEEMKANRQEAIDYFPEQYTKMLIENLDEYIEHFDEYGEDEDA